MFLNAKRDQLIKEILSPIMNERGFTLTSHKAEEHNRCWNYERKINNLLQSVSLLDSFYIIDLTLATNAYKQMSMSAREFTPKDKYTGTNIGWKYENQERFRKILIEMRELLLEYGFEALEGISVPATNEYPTPQSNQYLRDHWKKIAEEYWEVLSFEEKSCQEQFEIIQDMIAEEQNKSFIEAEAALVRIAAIYGDFLQRYYGGEWEWVDSNSSFVLDGIGEDDDCSYVLNDIVYAWKKKGQRQTFRDLQIEFGTIN